MSSVSQSTGSGTSFIPDYPQSAFLQQVASEANNYANQAYGRYDSTFQPLENALISDATKFQTPGYLSQVAGAASSGAAQAGEAQRTNSLRDLQAFGIDPSGGRYAELDKAERGRTAATQTGAAQEAVRQTQQAGRDMRMQAINIGQSNLNRATEQQKIAESMKYPPLGQSHTQQSTSSGSQLLTTGNNRGSQNNTSRGGGGGNNPSGGNDNPFTNTGAWNDPGNIPNTDAGSVGFRPSPFAAQTGGAQTAGLRTGGGGGGGGGALDTSPVNGPQIDQYTAQNNIAFGGQSDPLASTYGGYNTGGGANPGADNLGGTYDPTAYQSFDNSNTNPWGDTSSTAPAPLDNSNTGSWPQDNSAQYLSDSGGQYSSEGTTYADGSTDVPSGGDVMGFAQGGGIDIQNGGQVPQDASPSQGQQTDDIQANVNANEFVIPKDVALWKGQEFFQKLISSARKARLSAPAHGTPEPAMG